MILVLLACDIGDTFIVTCDIGCSSLLYRVDMIYDSSVLIGSLFFELLRLVYPQRLYLSPLAHGFLQTPVANVNASPFL